MPSDSGDPVVVPEGLLASGRRGAPPGLPSISHVIPSQLFQTLNSQRWNCNVLRRCRKMTVGNYVQHCSVRSGGPAVARAVIALVCGARCAVRGVWCAVRGARCLVCGARCAVCCDGLVRLSCSPRVPQPPGSLSISHVIPSRLFQTLNSQRWNCSVLRRCRKMTVGNYVRHCSVRCGGPAVARAVIALVCGVWCAVCGVWCAACGARRVVRGVWCAVSGVWCAIRRLADLRPRRAGTVRRVRKM